MRRGPALLELIGAPAGQCHKVSNYRCDIMSTSTSDPYELSRFIEAQNDSYDDALEEMKAGQKRTHWMWFIFPQVSGLGFSSMAQRYAIGSREEAEAYLAHPLLGARLRACVDALLEVEGRSAEQIMGSPDFLKLQSSITLFAIVAPAENRFERLLEKYCGGKMDQRTISFLTKAVGTLDE